MLPPHNLLSQVPLCSPEATATSHSHRPTEASVHPTPTVETSHTIQKTGLTTNYFICMCACVLGVVPVLLCLWMPMRMYAKAPKVFSQITFHLSSETGSHTEPEDFWVWPDWWPESPRLSAACSASNWLQDTQPHLPFVPCCCLF